jgi:8-oxo-dGTP pyrophosphatase MutT (NUDIX family)
MKAFTVLVNGVLYSKLMTQLNTRITCAGGIFLSRSTSRFLLLLRNNGRTAGTWGLAGGKQEPSDDTPYQALIREIEEELGQIPTISKTIPIERYSSPDDAFYYNTYVLIVENEFVPTLNDEHSGYCWVDYDRWPKPLHQGVKTTLSSRTTRAKLETILDLIK